jgi:cytochrome P450
MNETAIESPFMAARASALVRKASLLDTFLVAAEVFFPTLAKGVIVRRPSMLALADRLDLDRRAIRRMERVRDKYGTGPLLLRIPGRSVAVILAPEDVRRILSDTPAPFATDTKEKTAALAHFEPKGVLISSGPERADRRRFNEEVLDAHRPVHRLAESFVEIVESEVKELRGRLRPGSELDWNGFSEAWFRIVRRVVFGDAARDDHELSSMMFKLRSDANWAFLRPQRRELREKFLNRIRQYLVHSDPNSLAGVMAQLPISGRTAPEQQVPQWLFAFDPAGMAIFRSLALLATHPDCANSAAEEFGTRDPAGRSMPLLRATVLESLRLWPTSPLVLRESTAVTSWETGALPAHTAIVIFSPFFHRDRERLPYADRFSPELWMNGETTENPALIPFSDGPAVCPGRHLVLLLSTTVLSALLGTSKIRLAHPRRLEASQPLPATLNHFGLRFEMVR